MTSVFDKSIPTAVFRSIFLLLTTFRRTISIADFR